METSKDKSAEEQKKEILGKHCPVFTPLFFDKSNEPLVLMQHSIFEAMEEYASLSRLRELGEEKKWTLMQKHALDIIKAVTELHDPHGRFDTDYLKGVLAASNSIRIAFEMMHKRPAEKELQFCDKCGELYKTSRGHECLPSPPKEENV